MDDLKLKLDIIMTLSDKSLLLLDLHKQFEVPSIILNYYVLNMKKEGIIEEAWSIYANDYYYKISEDFYTKIESYLNEIPSEMKMHLIEREARNIFKSKSLEVMQYSKITLGEKEYESIIREAKAFTSKVKKIQPISKGECKNMEILIAVSGEKL